MRWLLAFALWPMAAWAQEATPAKPPLSLKDAVAVSKGEKLADDTDEQPIQYNTVVLQGLNKVTGHISTLESPIGTVQRFGNLEIIARRCWKSAPEDSPENAALLEIRELKPGEGPQQLFLGWMFSSSPGLSSLEHPVYDVTVVNCEARKDPEAQDKPEKPEKSEKTEKPKKKEKTGD